MGDAPVGLQVFEFGRFGVLGLGFKYECWSSCAL